VLRIFFGWPAVIGGWTVPMWLSWIGLVVTGGMSYFGISLAMRVANAEEATRVLSKRPRGH